MSSISAPVRARIVHRTTEVQSLLEALDTAEDIGEETRVRLWQYGVDASYWIPDLLAALDEAERQRDAAEAALSEARAVSPAVLNGEVTR